MARLRWANNPATLGLMADGSRIEPHGGFVGPDVPAPGSGRLSGCLHMPAIGWCESRAI
jgi:long-chain fatty acid transport protein